MPKKGDRSGYYVSCENCGKKVYKNLYLYNNSEHHFCSNACQKIFQRQFQYEMRKCEFCGKEFEIRKKIPQRFCSVRCQNEWQKTRVGKANGKYNRVEVVCDCCGEILEITPSIKKRYEHHFCSKDCKLKWYAEVFSQDEKWKEESRQRATRILYSGAIDTKTKPQIQINYLLDLLDIKYINEQPFVYYAVDNYLPDYNLIIEVMGDYWHSNPNKYQIDALRPIQKKVVGKDKAKHTYIKEYHNIQILYLWESDIYHRLDVCKQLIKQYIKTNGCLRNYHSFNYELSDKLELKLKEKITMPYQDIK